MTNQSPAHRLPGEFISTHEAERLDAGLDQLRRDISLVAAPPALETKLVAAFQAHHRKARAARRFRDLFGEAFAPGVALAASVGLAAWMMLVPAVPVMNTTGLPTASLGERADEGTPFFALQSLEQIALEPKPRLVRTTVPRMMLASYGVPVSPEVAGETMRAEMLMSANGQPLAMRFIP